MDALAQVDAAEVESEDDGATGPKCAGHAVDHLVVHGPAAERMGVADEGGLDWIRAGGLFEDGLKAAGGAVNEQRFDLAAGQDGSPLGV
jgi:hypothetical protein